MPLPSGTSSDLIQLLNSRAQQRQNDLTATNQQKTQIKIQTIIVTRPVNLPSRLPNPLDLFSSVVNVINPKFYLVQCVIAHRLEYQPCMFNPRPICSTALHRVPIGRAHVSTPVTSKTRMPSSAS